MRKKKKEQSNIDIDDNDNFFEAVHQIDCTPAVMALNEKDIPSVVIQSGNPGLVEPEGPEVIENRKTQLQLIIRRF